MKNLRFERFRRMQRQYHRNHPWRLSQSGLFVPHSYTGVEPHRLSWWDDVGFILNGRRVVVWWQHPRDVYLEAINDQSRKEAGDCPDNSWLLDGCTTNYRRVGKSRKRIVSYSCREPSIERQLYYDKLEGIRKILSSNGIDFEVPPSWQRKCRNWATCISLVAPMEVRNEEELILLAELARRLVLGQTSLESAFPEYRYNQADWLREQCDGGVEVEG